MSEVLNKVVDIVCDQLSVNKDDVNPESSFVEDLGADSLDTVELVMAFEEEFELKFLMTKPKKSPQFKVQLSGSKAIAKKTLVIIVTIGVLLFTAKLSYSVNQQIPLIQENTTFVIKKGETFNTVIERISEEFGTSDVFWTKLVYKIHGTPIVKAGRYNIYPETRLNKLIDRFSDGDVENFKFTIIEGTIASRAAFKLKDIIEINNLDIVLDEEIKAFFSKEAVIFPDTYFFSDSDDLKKFCNPPKSH